jgi:hypothetical protein
MNQQIHTYVHVLFVTNNVRLNIFINAHLLARYIGMVINFTPPYAQKKILDVPMTLTAQNEQDDGHSTPSTKKVTKVQL